MLNSLMGQLVRRLAVLVATVLVVGVVAAVPAHAGPGDGLGSLTVSPSSISPGATGDFEFTFTAGAQQMTDGSQLRVTVPADWTEPQDLDDTDPGYVELLSHTCNSPQTELNSITGMVILFDIKCGNGDTLVFTFKDVTVPLDLDDYTFETETYGGTGGGAFASIADEPAITVGGPVASLSATALDFGSVRVGSTSPGQSVTVTNTGNQHLDITDLEIDPDTDFDVLSEDCTADLIAAGEDCEVEVTFTPTTTGLREATLTITTDGGTPIVDLSGTGTTTTTTRTPTRDDDDLDDDDDIIVLPEPPIERLQVCPPDQVIPAGFADVPPGHVHEGAIDCIHWWGITVGTSATTYSPAMDTTRGQMASLVARLIEAAGGVLPTTAPDQFTDDDGHPHEANINRLAAAGLLQGVGGGLFEPNEPMRRDQMASVLVKAYAYLTGEQLRAAQGHFTDTAGNIHEDAIDMAAESGLTLGRTSTTYGPGDPVRRDQMASFLVRLLELVLQTD